MTTQETFNEEIIRIAGDVLESGELEKKLQGYMLKAFEDAFESSLSYGKVRDAIRSRVEEILVPYIERYDMGAYVVKLDAILTELLEDGAVGANRRVLENFRAMTLAPQNGTIALKDIFDAYKRHVAEHVDTSELEIDYDDEPSYSCVEVAAEFVPDDRPRWVSSETKYATLYLHPVEHEQEDLCFSLHLTKYSWNKGWMMRLDKERDVKSLANMNRFECYLMALCQGHVNLVDAADDLEDYVEPDAKPEATYE